MSADQGEQVKITELPIEDQAPEDILGIDNELANDEQKLEKFLVKSRSSEDPNISLAAWEYSLGGFKETEEEAYVTRLVQNIHKNYPGHLKPTKGKNISGMEELYLMHVRSRNTEAKAQNAT